MMTRFILIMLLVSSCMKLPSKRNITVKQKGNDFCCQERNPYGGCDHELIPGCYENSAPLFKENFFKADNCCKYWGADGVCHDEIVQGCAE